MRMNLPVTQQDFDYPSDQMLVSTTDTKGNIAHCNHAFVAVSGFTYDELIGQSHNLVRHPDMPPEAYKDMWQTIGRGRPWTGMIKNRRKNGDHYWVQANVTPILDNGKPKGYMSVRIKPNREQVQAAETLYAQMRAARESGRKRPAFVLRSGEVRYTGLRGLSGRLRRITITARMGMGLVGLVLLGMVPQLLEILGFHLQGTQQLGLQLASLVLGAVLLLAWFNQSFGQAIKAAEHFADDLAGCNLTTSVATGFAPPMDSLIRARAQRSGVAAKEIRDLIAQSAEQIAEGTQQMKHAGETIDEVVRSVRDVGTLIRQITNATHEQAIGIAQVNEAVTQLDTVTQQNAALVEQSAASAEDLSGSAVTLARAVQVFHLP